ncbi:cell division protein FtsQ/DivIB [Chromobacterium paludis]|uniref:Cell division protein FtsQ n=1 Tax=Chromobacterium paludis TaxID=2605945 RepID=A0A5C1DLF9_9NEIS|nr:cell division protein FtsQ/DivIB [Chromobacterium paludis]QEL57433.1 cell division protein FtsQ/DivIB [Chromobacterium paludis]
MWDNHRLLRSLANLLLGASALMLLYAGGFWLTHAPVFPVKKIRIQGDMNRVTAEQLKFIAEHELSGTFFTLDIDKTRAAFGKLPWVRDAQVRRRWPDALDITVEEHAALARWGENGLVNTRGERFDAASDANLPVFYGPAGAEKDMTAMLTQLRQALQPSGLAPRELWLSSRRAWKVVLDNQLELELGRNDAVARAERFATYWKSELARLPYHIEYVDLRYPNGFAVRMPDYKAPPAKGHK